MNCSSSRGNPSSISWGGEGDSYYEYIFKQWLQSGKQNDELKRQYLLAVDGMKARMLGKSAPSGFVFLSEIDANGQLGSRMEHLTCFVPGLLALGYKHGMPKDHLDLAKELARTCVQVLCRLSMEESSSTRKLSCCSRTADVRGVRDETRAGECEIPCRRHAFGRGTDCGLELGFQSPPSGDSRESHGVVPRDGRFSLPRVRPRDHGRVRGDQQGSFLAS